MAKRKITITIDENLDDWVKAQVEKGFFADKSHAVQFSLMKVKQLMDKGEIKF